MVEQNGWHSCGWAKQEWFPFPIIFSPFLAIIFSLFLSKWWCTSPSPMVPIPSKEVDEPKESELIHDSNPPRDSPTPFPRASKPSLSFLINWRGGRCNLMLIRLGRLSPKSRTTSPTWCDTINAPYTHFLRGLCTTKKTTNIPKRVFLVSNVSSMNSNQVPLNCKDLRCPVISIVIDNHNSDQAFWTQVLVLTSYPLRYMRGWV